MKPRADARALAARALLRMDAGEMGQEALDAVLSAAALEPRDAALCTELFYGFLRTEIRLEAVLGAVLRKPGKLPREAYYAIGLAAYSLFFLQRIPPHAAVDACVGHVRARFGQGLARVANGALRSLQRMEDAPQHLEFYTANGVPALHAQARYYAMPVWIADLWYNAYGSAATTHLLRRSFEQPWSALRVNVAHPLAPALREALASTLGQGGVACGRHGFAFAPRSTPETALGQNLSDLHKQGVFSWQAAGSQEVLARIPERDTPLWDACAGQGGKALALMEQGRRIGLCTDVHRGRLQLLALTAQRLGLAVPPRALCSMETPAIARWEGDILLDVPCSGFGTLARRPEIRRRRQPKDIVQLALLQQSMLERAWRILHQGQRLIYMTCTLNPAENENQVSTFMRAHGDAICELEWQTPHDHPWLEGMYIACLVKR